MKRIFVLLVAVAAIFAQDAFAQEGPKVTDEQKAAAKEKREQLMQTRLELLKTELTLSDEQFEKFDPVYRKFRQEIQRVTSMNRDARMKKEQITNENALKVVSARLANQILTSTVKQRYLMIFAEVIEPMQVMKLYRVDEKISREASKIMKYRATAATMDSATAK
ncbi:MAG: hypothetical protein IKB19_05320 [Rikenellaceae bacterium]|nr:hypothetical protein [Alistipes sp.]MBR2443701.1 hypothetical protein [Rikenellaceae bacterium]